MQWEQLFATWDFVQKWSSGVAFMLLVVGLCWPLERFAPRILRPKKSWDRLLAISILALFGIAVAQGYAWGVHEPAINLFVKFKFFSLAKLPVPDWILILIALLLLDFLYYVAHVAEHYFSPLWRLHKIHHADEHVTAFSALLHHPLEQLFLLLFVTGFAVVLGVPVLVYVYYGFGLAVHSVISHADVALPRGLDRVLRWLLVTPDVHRIHHSVDLREGNSNFGAIMTIWDRLFGTYIDLPQEPVGALSMGLPHDARPQGFEAMSLLLFPFRRK